MTAQKLRVFVAAATLADASAAYADMPSPDWMPKEQAIQKLSQQGYANAYLEADDGPWEGEATKGGRIYELHVDPHSGAITTSEPKH